jgi:hypothetical protein
MNPHNLTDHQKVCMGGDWHTFPSHFFLPSGAKLAYVEDNFHGLLPQHFLAPYGSSIASVLPINDQNQEEKSRYVPLDSCDYLVMTTPTCLLDIVPSAKEGQQRREVDESCMTALSPLQMKLVQGGEEREFLALVCQEVIDPGRSVSSLGRAYAIPYLSAQSNRFMHYCLYTKTMHRRPQGQTTALRYVLPAGSGSSGR